MCKQTQYTNDSFSIYIRVFKNCIAWKEYSFLPLFCYRVSIVRYIFLLTKKGDNDCILKVKSCLFSLSSLKCASLLTQHLFSYILRITFYKCVENMDLILSLLLPLSSSRHTNKILI